MLPHCAPNYRLWSFRGLMQDFALFYALDMPLVLLCARDSILPPADDHFLFCILRLCSNVYYLPLVQRPIHAHGTSVRLWLRRSLVNDELGYLIQAIYYIPILRYPFFQRTFANPPHGPPFQSGFQPDSGAMGGSPSRYYTALRRRRPNPHRLDTDVRMRRL